jgi:LysR family transcriptional regulator, benzoate and cis,cis-muconate-responsive activator of ben and cat genes
LELRHLRYAIAIADAGSFTRAALRLRLAQQALSRQIADLERELGVKLFERGARGARLTPAGTVFVHDARVALDQALQAIQHARAHTRGGKLRLAHAYLSPRHLASVGEALAEFHRSRPDTEVDVQHLATGAQAAALREGLVDVAFGYLAAADDDDTGSELFRDDPIVAVILPLDHPLASQHPLWLRDLADLPLVVPPRDLNPSLHDACMTGLADRGVEPRLAGVHAAGVPSLSVVAEGAWQLTLGTARPFADADPRIAYRLFADPPIAFGLWARYRREGATLLARDFIAVCRRLRDAATSLQEAG